MERSVVLNCQECGKPFRRGLAAHKLRVSRGQPEFCSNACYGAHRSKTYVGEANPRWTRHTLTCTHCGSEFTRQQFLVKPERTVQPFCTQACYHEWMQGKQFPRNNPRGPRSYPPEFKALRAQFFRDGVECVACGAPAVDLHHRDEDKENSDEDNLVPVCRACHATHHKTPVERQLAVLRPLNA
jgi:hypothetical protein